MNSCVDGEECMKPLRGLRSGRTYEAWVRAATSAGEGPPSTVVACQTSALGDFIFNCRNYSIMDK